MGFMSSYKKLDNLCRDMNGIGVTGYIEDMEQNPNGDYHVPGWKNDYYKLKRYRYIRNQIAHENDANEDNMCSAEDENWIKSFYDRIMVQKDPLALYYKVTRSWTENKPIAPKNPQPSQYESTRNDTNKSGYKPAGCGTMIVLTLAVMAVVLFALFS